MKQLNSMLRLWASVPDASLSSNPKHHLIEEMIDTVRNSKCLAPFFLPSLLRPLHFCDDLRSSIMPGVECLAEITVGSIFHCGIGLYCLV